MEDTTRKNSLTETELKRAKTLLRQVETIFKATVAGQDELRYAILAGVLTRGHILIESVPGLAKTTSVRTIASAISGSFRRVQCTPDLMPSDITGTQIYNQAAGRMETQLGPVHANIVLLDEINRSSAKTQSAMLEAMEERQTTIGGIQYPLPDPFMVLATQNPIEQEGTYVLPEAQMDRFLLKQVITYPTPSEELTVLERADSLSGTERTDAEPITLDEVKELQEFTDRVFVHPVLKTYIVDIINTSRGLGPRPIPQLRKHIAMGASPRGSLALMRIGRAMALFAGRNYVLPDDIKKMRHPILRHRLIRTYDGIAEGVDVNKVIDAIFSAVPVP